MAISDPSPDRVSPTVPGPSEAESSPKKQGWLWILLLLGLVVGGYFYYRSHTMAANKPTAPTGRGSNGPISVAVATALKQDVPYYLSGLGTVTPFNSVTVKSRVDGQLQKIYFTEGQFVHVGDLLAEIDPRPFQVALEQMEGQLARDQAQLNDARVNFARYDQLRKEGVVAQQQVDTQNAAVGQLEGAIRADQAQIDNEKLQLVYCRITAPLTGRLGLRLVDQGNMIHPSDPNGLVVITQVQPIAVLFTLPEDSLQDVIQHMRHGELAVTGYSRDDQTKLAAGKLVTIDNQIDPTTGTVRFKAVFPNQDLSLWPNQFVNVRLMLDVRKSAIVVPLAAVQRGSQGSYVYTVKGGHATLQPVQVDLTQGNISLIAKGIGEGDLVVVDGQDKLQSGSAVEAHNTSGGGDAAAGASGGSGRGGKGAAGKGDGAKAPDGLAGGEAGNPSSKGAADISPGAGAASGSEDSAASGGKKHKRDTTQKQ